MSTLLYSTPISFFHPPSKLGLVKFSISFSMDHKHIFFFKLVSPQFVWVELICSIFILGLFGDYFFLSFFLFLAENIVKSFSYVGSKEYSVTNPWAMAHVRGFWILAIIVKPTLIWVKIGPKREGNSLILKTGSEELLSKRKKE